MVLFFVVTIYRKLMRMLLQKMIARDLWYDIALLVPVDDLRLLSKASPMFDEIIHDANIRVFYGPTAVVLLRHRDYMRSCKIIQSSTGKKDILEWMIGHGSHYFKSCIHGNEIYGDNISWTDNPDLQKNWYLSLDTKIAMTCSDGYAMFTSNISAIMDSEFRAHITDTISAEINYIDFTNKLMVYWNDSNNDHDVAYESFKVIYVDGQFL